MPSIEIPGYYDVTVLEAEFGESKTGTPYLYLRFESEDEETIGSWSYLSEKAFEYTDKMLREVFDFDGNYDADLPKRLIGQHANINVKLELDDKGVKRPRVAYINKEGSGAAAKPISNQSDFLAKLTQRSKQLAGEPAARATAPARTPAPSASSSDMDEAPF